MSQSIWGSTDRGPVLGTYRIPVDTGSASTPGYITPAEMQTFLASISRSINSVSTATAAGSTANTDYVYFVTGTTTVTLPTAVGNTNSYIIKNVGVATVTIATTSAQTIDGVTSITLPIQYESYTLISDNANWNIVA